MDAKVEKSKRMGYGEIKAIIIIVLKPNISQVHAAKYRVKKKNDKRSTTIS
jgi:hypothetical protein